MTTKPQPTTEETPEPPNRISINPATAARYPIEDQRIGDIEYARVDRKYFCSCGAALTAEEYITHFLELGHDRGDPAVTASAAPVVDVKQQIADHLNEDRCMFCGGKTAHEPDCDHGPR